MKLCTDCRHYDRRGYAGIGGPLGAGCIRPLTDRIDPVNGWPADRLRTRPDAERKPGRTLFSRRLRCGPDAIWFERVEKPELTADEYQAVIWPAFRRALRQGLVGWQIDTAMEAARAESMRWIGHLDTSEALGAIVGAAFAAVSDEMQKEPG